MQRSNKYLALVFWLALGSLASTFSQTVPFDAEHWEMRAAESKVVDHLGRQSLFLKGGLAVLGGTSFGISTRFSNFIELKYHHLPGFSQLKINWGLSYSM